MQFKITDPELFSVDFTMQRGVEIGDNYPLKCGCNPQRSFQATRINKHMESPTHVKWLESLRFCIISFEEVIRHIEKGNFWIHQYTLNTKEVVYLTFVERLHPQSSLLATLTITHRSDMTGSELFFVERVPYAIVEKMEKVCMLHSKDRTGIVACQARNMLLHWNQQGCPQTASATPSEVRSTTSSKPKQPYVEKQRKHKYELAQKIEQDQATERFLRKQQKQLEQEADEEEDDDEEEPVATVNEEGSITFTDDFIGKLQPRKDKESDLLFVEKKDMSVKKRKQKSREQLEAQLKALDEAQVQEFAGSGDEDEVKETSNTEEANEKIQTLLNLMVKPKKMTAEEKRVRNLKIKNTLKAIQPYMQGVVIDADIVNSDAFEETSSTADPLGVQIKTTSRQELTDTIAGRLKERKYHHNDPEVKEAIKKMEEDKAQKEKEAKQRTAEFNTALQKTQEIDDDEEEHKQDEECLVCKEPFSSMVKKEFFPCCHAVCQKCMKRLDRCPICRL